MSARIAALRSHRLTERERAPPDAAAKPEGKALKTSRTAAFAQGNVEGQGTHTGDQTDATSSSGQSAADGIEADWRYVETDVRA